MTNNIYDIKEDHT